MRSISHQPRNSMGPFGARFFSVLKYDEIVPLTDGGLGTATVLSWRTNSLHDPYFSGAGHQPRGYDQLTPFYNRHRVWRCDYNVRITAPAAGINQLCYGGICLHTPENSIFGGSTGKTYQELRELPNVRMKRLTSSDQPGSSISFRGTVWLPIAFGVNKIQFKALDQYAAVTGSVPASSYFLEIFVLQALPTAQNQTFTLEFSATYYSMHDQFTGFGPS